MNASAFISSVVPFIEWMFMSSLLSLTGEAVWKDGAEIPKCTVVLVIMFSGDLSIPP